MNGVNAGEALNFLCATVLAAERSHAVPLSAIAEARKSCAALAEYLHMPLPKDEYLQSLLDNEPCFRRPSDEHQ